MPRNTKETLMSDWIMPPMFTAGTTGTGQTYAAQGPSVFLANTTTTYLDLTTICGSPAKESVPIGTDDYDPDPLGHYVTIQADADDIYVAFGDSPASIGVISPTLVSTIDGGTISGATGKASASFTQTGSTASGCIKIPQNTERPFLLPVGSPPPGKPYDNADVGKYSPARYLGFRSNVGATAYIRIWQSSP